MPTYEYYCPKCDRVFEVFQSITEEPLEYCPHPEGCQHPKAKVKVKRLISGGAGIIFKGSGFYQTDYRSKEYHQAAKNEKQAQSSTSTNTKKKSEPKPAAKSTPSTDKS